MLRKTIQGGAVPPSKSVIWIYPGPALKLSGVGNSPTFLLTSDPTDHTVTGKEITNGLSWNFSRNIPSVDRSSVFGTARSDHRPFLMVPGLIKNVEKMQDLWLAYHSCRALGDMQNLERYRKELKELQADSIRYLEAWDFDNVFPLKKKSRWKIMLDRFSFRRTKKR